MSLQILEEKFKRLDKKDKFIRRYFDPKAGGSVKHAYAHELIGDFKYRGMDRHKKRVLMRSTINTKLHEPNRKVLHLNLSPPK
jgi:hypothetical protein